MPARSDFVRAFRERAGRDKVLVHRGKAGRAKVDCEWAGRDWWGISLAAMVRAIFAFVHVTLVALGAMAWAMNGLPVGGAMSSAAASILLGYYDVRWLDSASRPRQASLGFHLPATDMQSVINWCRCVGDILAVSSCLCGDCLCACFSSPDSQCL